MILILRSASPYSFMAVSFPHSRSVSGSPHFTVSTSHILSGVVRARNKMQRGTWLVESRFSDKPKVVTKHSGVSYACFLVPVVRHSPPGARASALDKGRCHLHVSAELHTRVLLATTARFLVSLTVPTRVLLATGPIDAELLPHRTMEKFHTFSSKSWTRGLMSTLVLFTGAVILHAGISDALIRQRNTCAFCWPWRPSRACTLKTKVGVSSGRKHVPRRVCESQCVSGCRQRPAHCLCQIMQVSSLKASVKNCYYRYRAVSSSL